MGVDPVCVLGLNTNKGARIQLRLRTDDMEGFRKMDNIRKVLYHELAHNTHSDHDAQFYSLMRQIEKDAFALDWRTSKGHQTGGVVTSHAVTSSGGGDREKHDGPRKLGGESSLNGLTTIFSAKTMAGLAATMRLTEEERAIERGCGSDLPPAGGGGGDSVLNSHDSHSDRKTSTISAPITPPAAVETAMELEEITTAVVTKAPSSLSSSSSSAVAAVKIPPRSNPTPNNDSSYDNSNNCPVCGLAFHDAVALVSHYESNHPTLQKQPTQPVTFPSTTTTSSSTSSSMLHREVCPHCSARFKDVIELVAHVSTNHG